MTDRPRPGTLPEEPTTLRDFLAALAACSATTPVSLTRVSRRRFVGGMTRIEAGILLQQRPADRLISCCVLAVEASLVGGRGRCISPMKETSDHPQVFQQITDGCTELLTLLTTSFEAYPHAQVRYGGASLPPLWTWETQLADLSLHFQDGHWRHLSPESTPPTLKGG